MLVAIMQPTFLPWLGYFDMIRRADMFIFLDDVQLSPKSWQVRNKIPKLYSSAEWLTIKASDGNLPFNQRILNQTRLRDGVVDLNRIVTQLENRYGRTPDALDLVLTILKTIELPVSIAEINILMIRQLCKLLSIPSVLAKSSEFEVSGSGSRKIIDLLKACDATDYLVAPGSIPYMRSESVWADYRAMCLVHNYEPKPYQQRRCEKFVSHMSVIDSILELGVPAATEILIDGSRKPTPWNSGVI